MDPARLQFGKYVLWDPPEDGPTLDLTPGDPGIIIEPDWQDVGVKWLFREWDVVSQHVYDYRWLKEVGPEEFVAAANAYLERRRRESD